MKQNQLTEKQKKLFSGLFVAAGMAIVFISMGIIPVEESSVHAPGWVIGLCGGIFILAGVMILAGEKAKINNLLAALLVLAMGMVGGWVALFGSEGGFSGGIPFISSSTNVSIARVLFGSGAIICFFLSAYAAKKYFTGRKKDL